MPRRTVLLGAWTSGALACPAVSRAAGQAVLRFLPQQDLAALDPMVTTAYMSRNHGYMVFDTLYGMDGQFQPLPPMVEGYTVLADGRQWDLVLRPGLVFHDGSRVLARDCVASVRRWARRDPFGATLMEVTDGLPAVGDRTIRFRLGRPFPLLPTALGKAGVPTCPIAGAAGEHGPVRPPQRGGPATAATGPWRTPDPSQPLNRSLGHHPCTPRRTAAHAGPQPRVGSWS